MKKYIAAMLCAFSILQSTYAQNSDSESKRTVVEKPSRDFVMIKLTNSAWANKPDSIHTKGIGRGVALSIMYDFPIKKSNFSFAVGLGISAQNVFLDKQLFNFKDTGSQVLVQNTTAFKRYKFTTTRLELPVELRFFGNNKNRNTGFKAAIGVNVGMFLSSHTKGISGSGGSKFNDKTTTKRFNEQWSFAPTLRIGYGNFSLYGSYSLTPVFKDAAGPELYPVSLGICITGL